MNLDPNQFDKSKFTNKPYVLTDTLKPWGHEVIFTKSDEPYTGKLIYLNAGKQWSLQIHDKKRETQMLIKGKALLISDNDKGELVEVEMEPLKGYEILPGQRHRSRAITDCEIMEVSTPEIGTTYRLEDDYKRTDQTEELRQQERKTL